MWYWFIDVRLIEIDQQLGKREKEKRVREKDRKKERERERKKEREREREREWLTSNASFLHALTVKMVPVNAFSGWNMIDWLIDFPSSSFHHALHPTIIFTK